MRAPPSLRDRLRAQLADLKMPGALEALDDILAGVDGGTLQSPAAIEPSSVPRSRSGIIAGSKPRCAPPGSRS